LSRIRRHQEALFQEYLKQHKWTLKINSLHFCGRYPSCRERNRKFDNVTFVAEVMMRTILME